MVKNQFCCFYEVFRTFLEGYPAKEGYYFFRNSFLIVMWHIWQMVNCIIYCENFFRWYAIAFYDNVPCPVAHSDDEVGVLHSVFFNVVNLLVDVFSAAVKLCGMYVDNQWPTRDFFCFHTSKISQPVMRMDKVKLVICCNFPGY